MENKKKLNGRKWQTGWPTLCRVIVILLVQEFGNEPTDWIKTTVCLARRGGRAQSIQLSISSSWRQQHKRNEMKRNEMKRNATQQKWSSQRENGQIFAVCVCTKEIRDGQMGRWVDGEREKRLTIFTTPAARLNDETSRKGREGRKGW